MPLVSVKICESSRTSPLKMFLLMVVVLLVFTKGPDSEAARILAVFPLPSKSQQMVLTQFSFELSKRGHELTVFTPYPMHKNTSNYKEYFLSDLRSMYMKRMSVHDTMREGSFRLLRAMYSMFENAIVKTFNHPEMQALISPNSTAQFDLILMQFLYMDALTGLSYRFNAPIVGFCTLPMLAVHHYIMGNTLSAAFTSDILLALSVDDLKSNFWYRAYNMYYLLRQIYEYNYISLPVQEEIKARVFGENTPPIKELSKNISIMLVNSNPFFNDPKPYVTEIVQIGGLLLNLKDDKFDPELDKILNEATEGFVYFSLGTNIESESLSTEILNKFTETFVELPFKVIWKYGSRDFPNRPKNVITRKWFPQNQILRHPNLIVFIYQGGIHSTEEALNNGVPLIAFPLIADQIYNVKQLVSHGVAIHLDLFNFQKEDLKQAIFRVANDRSYKNNAVKLGNLLSDRPFNPMEHAIWWIEHVIRHKGARHVYTGSRDMSWFQAEMYDILLAFFLAITLLIYVIFISIRSILRKLFARKIFLAKKPDTPLIKKTN